MNEQRTVKNRISRTQRLQCFRDWLHENKIGDICALLKISRATLYVNLKRAKEKEEVNKNAA